MNSDGKGLCNCCGSIISLDDKGQPYIAQNNVSFDRSNFAIGIISLLGSIGFLILVLRNNGGLGFVGIAFLFAPLVGLVQHELFYRWDKFFQNFGDLHRALISGRIRFYDIGSKFLVYSMLGIQLTGIFLILIKILS